LDNNGQIPAKREHIREKCHHFKQHMYISQYDSDTGEPKPKTEFQVYGPGKNLK
jgi:hypothetical protein